MFCASGQKPILVDFRWYYTLYTYVKYTINPQSAVYLYNTIFVYKLFRNLPRRWFIVSVPPRTALRPCAVYDSPSTKVHFDAILLDIHIFYQKWIGMSVYYTVDNSTTSTYSKSLSLLFDIDYLQFENELADVYD